MAVIENLDQQLVADTEAKEKLALREERRRTGRYMAAGTAIFLSLLGLYQAVVSGTPQYAALFAPALIMFIYILWIVYASRNQRGGGGGATTSSVAEDVNNENLCDEIVTTLPTTIANCNNKVVYSRSYSIA